MPPIRDWPGWLQLALSATVGVCATLVTVTLTFADVRRDAQEAKDAIPKIEEKVRRVEDAMLWVKSALRTGRDPDTGTPFPWVR